MAYVGLDVGTTGVKGVLVDKKGQVLKVAFSPYPMNTPHPGWAEQNPLDWWRAVVEVMREFSGQKIDAISFSGQMHSLVLLDAAGNPIMPSILWCDQRTSDETKFLEKLFGKEAFLRVLGNPPLTGFTAPKLLWVKRNLPYVLEKARYILTPKDYIRYLMTDVISMEITDAAGTALFDIYQKTWAWDLIEKMNLKKCLFPDIVKTTQVVGKLTETAANEFGISSGIPVIGGAADNVAGAVGAGVVAVRDLMISIGSSGVLLTPTDEPCVDRVFRYHTFNYVDGLNWYNMGVILSAGMSLRWLRDTFFKNFSYDAMLVEAAKVSPGSHGLWFMPYLQGERSPHKDPYIRGAFIGISTFHKPEHFVRAVIEGVAFAFAEVYYILKESLGSFTKAVAVGGGARSKLWLQIISDLLDLKIVLNEIEEGPAYGASIFAAVGVGEFSSVKDAVESWIKKKDEIAPTGSLDYIELFQTFKKLYPSLKGVY